MSTYSRIIHRTGLWYHTDTDTGKLVAVTRITEDPSTTSCWELNCIDITLLVSDSIPMDSVAHHADTDLQQFTPLTLATISEITHLVEEGKTLASIAGLRLGTMTLPPLAVIRMWVDGSKTFGSAMAAAHIRSAHSCFDEAVLLARTCDPSDTKKTKMVIDMLRESARVLDPDTFDPRATDETAVIAPTIIFVNSTPEKDISTKEVFEAEYRALTTTPASIEE